MLKNPHKLSKTHYSEGLVLWPSLLYGFLGVVLAFILQKLGLFESANKYVSQLIVTYFSEGEQMVFLSTLVSIAIAVLCSVGVAWVVLDSRGAWRRMIVVVSSVVLVLALAPTLAVWNVYFSPFFVLVSVLWASLCSFLYTSYHRMPCDVERRSFISKETLSHG